jgi:hypothetical protein
VDSDHDGSRKMYHEEWSWKLGMFAWDTDVLEKIIDGCVQTFDMLSERRINVFILCDSRGKS